jgi:serine/threonine protein kinase
MRGHYSIKSDVFSFGVLILEILTGRRSSGSINIEQSVDLLSLVSHSTIPKPYTQVICFKNANGINI